MTNSSIKYSSLLFLHLFFAGIIILFTAWYPSQAGGPHGGTMKKADNYFIEIRTLDKSMHVYLMDNNLDDISNKGVSGEVKFFAEADSSIINIPLQAIEEKAFIVEAIPSYNSCKVIFHIDSREVSARFENPRATVKGR